ncbi:MAG: DUF1127 domain-containing protein [Rhodobacteraceae bacterium]|nr:DUF1127 domain-containing protein [Paracoccaceae bacterium]
MNRTDTTIHFHSRPLMERLDLYLVGQGMGFNTGLEKRRRLHEAYALDALSDCQLALMGMSRADIPAFVFADLFGA